ncbi:50S ribosomal protein L11 methyltransferase [Bradyrhizobium sp. Ash2021]|uniref:50S ribosomal protein L11 methyltransferase n=1 Tax=Bradyrhizobium sp. Ash2021 TaxID=2954771 RepID=UPI002815BA1A|nr:50S ribosomal protein L11 methyltransferase [Bradyrhizobium sp. Ash2021]WMT75980.1 50S ribosomal protein L11 methyltransferase [Bradyrhizobium sp. Ash2021]
MNAESEVHVLERLNGLLQIDPHDPGALIEKGALLHRLGKAEEAALCFEAACQIASNNELALTNLAVALAESGKRHDAVVALRRVVGINPGNHHARHQLRRLLSMIVPFWHPRMLNDAGRNDAFERAIRVALEKESQRARILDIGTGSGLLSMMAARAGATSIDTCERVQVIAEAAEQIIAANNFQDQIRVIRKSSDELVVGRDIEERADILISEIVSSDLLAEGVLDTFQDAHSRLIRPNATIIPQAAAAVGCLVESAILHRYAFVSDVSGFDLSPFTALAPLRLPVHGTMTSWRRLSRDFEIVRIDLTAPTFGSELSNIAIKITADGEAVGVIQWISLDLAEGVKFSNHPDGNFDGGWLQILHTFPRPISVAAGEWLELIVGHDRASIIVSPANL